MKILSGSELVAFIKERQAKQVRNLKQAHGVAPKLAIVRCNADNQVISTYIRLKRQYGDDIGVDVEVFDEDASTVATTLQQLNERGDVHGIIVQLPVIPTEMTDEVIELVDPQKDVDGLTRETTFDPATPMAILWLLAGYNVNLERVAVVGRGRLVGAPLEKMLRNSNVDVVSYGKESTGGLKDQLRNAKIIVTATGQPGLITSDMVAQNAVVIDAGTASEDGVIRGDLAADIRERQDLSITPEKGGVGPLTVAALFDNVLTAARRKAQATQN